MRQSAIRCWRGRSSPGGLAGSAYWRSASSTARSTGSGRVGTARPPGPSPGGGWAVGFGVRAGVGVGVRFGVRAGVGRWSLRGQQAEGVSECARCLGRHRVAADLAGVVAAEQGPDGRDDGQLRLHGGQSVLPGSQDEVDEAVGHPLLAGALVAGGLGGVGVLA